MGIIGKFPPNTTAVMGVPIGKINDLNTRVGRLETSESSQWITSGNTLHTTKSKVGIDMTTVPTSTFQVGDPFTITAPATGFTAVGQNYDDSGECYQGASQVNTARVYPYRDTSIGRVYGTSSNTANYTENGSGLAYFATWSWTASVDTNVSGYILYSDLGGGYWDVGNVTSVDDDGCNYGASPDFSVTSLGPVFTIDAAAGDTKTLGKLGIGRTATTNPLEVKYGSTSGIDVISGISTFGSNNSGDIRILDPNTGNVMFKVGEAGANVGSVFGQYGYQTAANQILSEWDVFNGSYNGPGSDKRMVVVQGLTGTTRNVGQFIVALEAGGGSTPIHMIMRGDNGNTAFSSSGLTYGTNMASTLTDYGNMSIGSSYTNTAAPSNGLIVQGQIGAGVSSTTAGLHLGAGSSSASTAPLKFTSGTKMTTAEAGAAEYNGNFYLSNANLRFPVGGPLFDHFADVNNGTTVETDLYSDTLVASTFANNGDKVVAQYGGTFAGSATSTQELRAYLGGTKIFDSGALSIGAATDSWNLDVTCVRESSSNVRCSVSLTTNFATLSSYATYTKVTGLTLSNTQVLKITGQAGGVGGGSNQITASEGYVEFKPAA